MAYKEIRYGVTWKTLMHKKNTTVWFKTKGNRSSYIKDLQKNPIVIKSSISLSTRQFDGNTIGE